MHLSPKAFDMLEMLVQRAPEAVSQQEICEHLWPDTIVNVATLHNLVSQIRGSLSDHDHSLIRTIYGYGFSFGARASEVEVEPPRTVSSFWLLIERETPGVLFEGENLIGGDDGADLRLAAQSISRRHAILVIDWRAGDGHRPEELEHCSEL